MSGNVFIAFLFNKIFATPDDDLTLDPLSWVRQQLSAADIPLAVAEENDYPVGVRGLPYMSADWLRLAPEVQVHDEEDYRALIFLINENRFYRVSREIGARHIAEAFRDACNATKPVYGIFDLTPWDNVPEHLRQMDAEISGVNTSRLARTAPDLLYVSSYFVNTLADNLLPRQVDELAGDNGIILSPDGTLGRWANPARSG